jgi:hypothetical protein
VQRWVRGPAPRVIDCCVCMNSSHFVIFAHYNTAANVWGGWESATVRGAQYIDFGRSVHFMIGLGSGFFPFDLFFLSSIPLPFFLGWGHYQECCICAANIAHERAELCWLRFARPPRTHYWVGIRPLDAWVRLHFIDLYIFDRIF